MADPSSMTAPAEQKAPKLSAAEEPLKPSLDEIQMLLTSDERKELIGKLGGLIRQGDTKGAREFISGAISAGALAYLLNDQIDDPALQAWLRTMAIERPGAGVSIPAQTSGSGAGTAEKASHVETEEALQRQRGRSDALQQQLKAAQEQVEALKATGTRAASLQNMLEREKEQTASLTQELEMVRRQLSDAQKGEVNVSELRDAVAHEKSRADAAMLELTAAQKQMSASKANAAETAEVRTILEREKEHSISMGAELERLRQQLSVLEAGAAKSDDIEKTAAREKQRADRALQQLGSLQEQLSTLKESEAKARDSFRQEKERGVLIGQQLETATREIAALAAEAKQASEVKKALQQEKEKTAVALRELHAVKGQLVAFESHVPFIPAALTFQTHLTLPPMDARETGTEKQPQNTVGDREGHKVRQKPQPPDRGGTQEPANNAGKTRSGNPTPLAQAEGPRGAKPSPGHQGPGATPNKSVSMKNSRPQRRLPREAQDAVDAPDLPAALQPDNRLWQFY